MQVNVAGLRRNIKNIAYNYTEAQIKVREATSNDPWGPSSTILAEISDLSYNVIEYTKIMEMIWRRLSDQGRNWRHVHKGLILMDYLVKTGVEKVAKQCKENIFAIEALRGFVYYEEGKDFGRQVRERATQLVNLLRDNERLRNERLKALKAKERFTRRANGFGYNDEIPVKPISELEMVRPQTMDEEELHLKLAMDISREEAEQAQARKQNDEMRLKIALKESERDFKNKQEEENLEKLEKTTNEQKVEIPTKSHLFDLLDISLGAASTSNNVVQFGNFPIEDTWPKVTAEQQQQQIDPWQPITMPVVQQNFGWSSSIYQPIQTPAPPLPYGWSFNDENKTIAISNYSNNLTSTCNDCENDVSFPTSSTFRPTPFNEPFANLNSNIDELANSLVRSNSIENGDNFSNQLYSFETKPPTSTNPFL